ncbi:DUF302 domain-containing protein [Zhengella sp. ZM62]|uniref:DUF302 domain-containing protein n=1 Tax=Zhengella sedimenti TaxID=3390035 RepID=UPI003974E34D
MRIVLIAAISMLAATAAQAADGWIVKDSSSDVATTADRLVSAVEKAGAKVFARVDHAKGAEETGQPIPPATLVMFGNPWIGTPVMAADPKAGLDLPIRVLIWDDGGQTRIGYLSADELADRYALDDAGPALEAMAGAVGKLTDAAAR